MQCEQHYNRKFDYALYLEPTSPLRRPEDVEHTLNDLTWAQIAAQAQRLEYYKLVSPMDGTVLKEDGEVGDMVEPGTILYRIGLEKPLWVVAEVNEEDIPRVQVGQKALLRTDAFANQVLPGFVKQITPAGDPIAKTFRVRIGLPDDTPLRVGMSVEANIVSREKSDVDPGSRECRRPQLAVHDRKRPGPPAQSRDRHSRYGLRGDRQGVIEGELVASPATTNIKNGSRIRPRRRRRRHETGSGHRLDPCPPPRPPDAGGNRRRNDRCRLFDHDGGHDGGIAGRFHQAPGRCLPHISVTDELPGADATARRDHLSSRRISRPDAGGASAGHQESDGHDRVAAVLGARRGDAVGAVEGRAALRRPQPHHSVIGIDPAPRADVSNLATPDAQGTLASLYRATNAILLGDRLAARSAHGSTPISRCIRRRRHHDRHRGRHLPFRRASNRRDDRLCTAQDRANTAKSRPASSTRFACAPRDPMEARLISERIGEQTGYKSVSWQEAQEDLLSASRSATCMMYTMVGAILLVASFGTYNIISTITHEKTRDIAILKSLGFRDRTVRSIFIIEAR